MFCNIITEVKKKIKIGQKIIINKNKYNITYALVLYIRITKWECKCKLEIQIIE